MDDITRAHALIEAAKVYVGLGSHWAAHQILQKAEKLLTGDVAAAERRPEAATFSIKLETNIPEVCNEAVTALEKLRAATAEVAAAKDDLKEKIANQIAVDAMAKERDLQVDVAVEGDEDVAWAGAFLDRHGKEWLVKTRTVTPSDEPAYVLGAVTYGPVPCNFEGCGQEATTEVIVRDFGNFTCASHVTDAIVRADEYRQASLDRLATDTNDAKPVQDGDQ